MFALLYYIRLYIWFKMIYSESRCTKCPYAILHGKRLFFDLCFMSCLLSFALQPSQVAWWHTFFFSAVRLAAVSRFIELSAAPETCQSRNTIRSLLPNQCCNSRKSSQLWQISLKPWHCPPSLKVQPVTSLRLSVRNMRFGDRAVSILASQL